MSVTLSQSLKKLFGSNSNSNESTETVSGTHTEKLKWFGFGVALLFVLLIIDYVINQSGGQQGDSDLLPELPIETQMKQSNGGEEVVLDLYSQFDLPKAADVAGVDKEDESTAEVIDSMSLAEQNQQSGLLSKLYIGDAIYRLSGIVRSGNYKSGESRAALSVSYTQVPADSEESASESTDATQGRLSEGSSTQSPQTGKTNMSLFKGDNLGPYLVESVDSRRLVLVDNGRRLWLELFVPLHIKRQDGEELIGENGYQ